MSRKSIFVLAVAVVLSSSAVVLASAGTASRLNSSTSADHRAYPETRWAPLGGAAFGLVALLHLPTDLRFCRSAGLPCWRPSPRFWRFAGPWAERLPVPSRQAGE